MAVYVVPSKKFSAVIGFATTPFTPPASAAPDIGTADAAALNEEVALRACSCGADPDVSASGDARTPGGVAGGLAAAAAQAEIQIDATGLRWIFGNGVGRIFDGQCVGGGGQSLHPPVTVTSHLRNTMDGLYGADHRIGESAGQAALPEFLLALAVAGLAHFGDVDGLCLDVDVATERHDVAAGQGVGVGIAGILGAAQAGVVAPLVVDRPLAMI